MHKTVVITGVTSGIGKALTEFFVSKGERVIGISRNPALIKALDTELTPPQHGVKPMFIACDFASFTAMQKALEQLRQACDAGIDVLINNAAIVPQKKHETEDGFELQYQVNHLAPAMFTLELMGEISRVKGMVITTGSDAHKWVRFNKKNIENKKRYHALTAYMRTKLYNVLFAAECRHHFSTVPIMHYVVHPGRVKTDIGTKDVSRLYAWVWRRFTRNGRRPEETVASYERLVYETPGLQELYFYDTRPHKTSKPARSRDNQRILFRKTLDDVAPYRKKKSHL